MKFSNVVAVFFVLGAASGNAAAAPYIGAQLGHEDFKIDFTDKEPGFGDLKSEGLGASGYSGGVYGGLRFGGDDGFFAVELNYSSSNAEYKDSFEGSETTIEAGTGYGLGFLVGTTLDKAKLYARLGGQRTDFDIKDGIGTDSIEDEMPWGFRFGVGAELPLDDVLSLRADWSRTFYDEIISENPFTGREFTYEPEQTLFQIGITATFN